MEANNRHKSHKKLVLAWLQKGKGLTQLQALNRFGCFRLAVVIHRLRGDGFNIQTESVNIGGKVFARYWLQTTENL